MSAPDHARTGLGEEEALRRLEELGPNDPVVLERASWVRALMRRFTSPLVAILLIASVASAFVREFSSSLIIFVMIVLSIAIDLYQTRRSERAAAALKEKVAQTTTVQRDGAWREIDRRAIVPGDVVRVTAGDMVPADAELLDAKDLHLSEAALTGESLPVERRAGEPVSMGTSVVSGHGVARVVRTGPRTAFGEIAKNLAAHPPPTEFERGVLRFGVFILKTVLFLVLLVFSTMAAFKKDPLESLLFAVALAVGLTPEFLPMITTVTLSRGAVRMARARVVVKNLAAIQNFGSIDVLCSDKTGTLTTGTMTLDAHVDPRGASSERPLLFAYVSSYFETGVDNPVDEAVLRKGKLDPLASAVLRHEHPDITGYAKVDEIPFDFERRRVSVLVERGGERLLVTKGAPEFVLDVCGSAEVDGAIVPLDAERARGTYEALSRKGERVLAVACKTLDVAGELTKGDESALVLVGFVAFEDPPRSDAADVVRALRDEGIRVKVLTGDNDLVAAHVCGRVGLASSRVLTGAQLDALDDAALGRAARDVDVFARVSPAQKTRVLRALRASGHVVGFMGDGINDAPSLHAADVGISVSNATDVAKEAADIILLEPDLRVLLSGVLEGRAAFGNVMKYLLMGTSSNFGNMFSMAVAAAVLPFLPMLPTQILLNNFLYDLAQITIPTDRVDPAMIHKPRRWNIDLIRTFMIWIGPVSSVYDILTFWVLLRVFHASEALFHTGWFVESLATQTLVIFVIRTMKSPLSNRPSVALTVTTIGIVLLGMTLPFLPLGAVLGFVPLPALYFAFLVVATATYLGLVEVVKRVLFKRAFA